MALFKENMNVFFDLDGTLLDSRERLYHLFCDLTKQTILSFDQYWVLKREKINHRTILCDYFGYSKDQEIKFEDDWLSLIEDIRYLNLDKPFVFTQTVLESISKKHKLYVVTARQSKERVIYQLNNLSLFDYFEDILVTEARKTKTELILELTDKLSCNDILAGDTGLDILTAKEVGCRSLAVLSGFRNREILSTYKPDYIEENIQSILKYV